MRSSMKPKLTRSSDSYREPRPRISFNPNVIGVSPSSLYTGSVYSNLGESDECEENSRTQKPKKEKLSRYNVSELLYDDVEELKGLMNQWVCELFHVDDPFETIHKCFISYKLTNTEGNIVAVMSMEEFPNVPSLPMVGWAHWAEKLYNIKDVTSYNTMWVHMVAYKEKYKDSFLMPLLNNLFHEYMTKQYCLFVIPSGCHHLVSFLDGCSSVVLPQDFTDPMKVQTIRLCVRQDFITQYKIRRAVEEDNDDLVPLINEFSPRFVELYGEYYVAEIIGRHPDAGRNIIVAEHEGEAVSVLCLNPTVNYQQLNDCFDLHVFTGLYKADTAQQVKKQIQMQEPIKASQADESEPVSDKSVDFITDWFSHFQQKPKETSSADNELVDSAQDKDMFSILNELENLTVDQSSTSVLLNVIAQPQSDISISNRSQGSLETGESELSELPFFGEENAFAIEILAAQPKHVPSLSLLIVSCFECFPTRDYCLMMIPHNADYSPIMKYFVRVQPKLNAQHAHDLYVCHRGQISPITIKCAEEADIENVTNFLSLIKHPNSQVEIKNNFLRGISGEDDLETYIALSGKHGRYVVGLAQVSRVRDVAAVKLKYAVNRWSDITRDQNSSFGYIASFIMCPLFNGHISYFLRDLHRKAGYRTLFYALNYHDAMDYRVRPLSFAMQNMWLVPPREIMVSLKKQINDYPEEPYALFMSTQKLMSKPVVQINYRIVVIGASETALSFLEALLKTQVAQYRVSFNNVLLVSTDGLARNEKPHALRDMLLATHTLRDSAYLEKTALRSMITVLTGSLTSINRKQKTIQVNTRIVIPYDYLFIMSGIQYGSPKKIREQEYVRTKLPTNSFTINTEVGADFAIKQLKELLQNTNDPYQIVVYGHSIDCYCCIAALLEYGIPGPSIIFVDPWPRDRDPPVTHDFVFQDGQIYETVVNTITSKYKIDVRTGFKLIDWSSKPLTLRFESLTRYVVLTPICSFLYGDKELDMNIFNAISEAGLVFDGRLVIDPDCHTSDKNIYAAGPHTKYSRKLWADHLSHRYFNSSEIGARLGADIRAQLLPFKERKATKFDFGDFCDSQFKYHVPRYVKPLITYCKLPGGLYYLNVTQPGVQIPLETAMSDSDYGSVFTTGSPKNLKGQGYFRIHLNNLRTVETITCLSMQKFDYRKLSLLWGKHESLLNNLVCQFEALAVTDFFEYFQSAWCAAIFHDDFPILETAIMKVMTSSTEFPGNSPLEDLARMYTENSFQSLSPEQREYIMKKFTDSEFEEKIKSLIVNFIRDNLGILDMYAHPVVVNYILSGYEHSPLFKQI